MKRDDIPDQWMDDALCAQTDPELFMPEKGGSSKAAKRVCGSCPVAAECLRWALENDERRGVYGGLTARERAPLHRAHNSVQPPSRPRREGCGKGHDWTVPSNVGVRGRGRYCKACDRDRQQERRDRRAAA